MDNLPLLALSSEQIQIIDAHTANAIGQIVATKFGESERTAINNIIFFQGQLGALSALRSYDADQLARAKEEQS